MTKGSGDARTQPLYFLIITAGTVTHSICYEQHEKAEDILAGKKHDPTFYSVIYGAGREDDWTDEAVWHKANPSLGITVPIKKVHQAFASAKQNPAEENAFRQLRLNQWVNQSVRWMPMHIWTLTTHPSICLIWRSVCVTAGSILRRRRISPRSCSSFRQER
ncbi:terminase TerL endonuclease subunit [Corynebacterium diphtheriae]|uniref:Terminase large subunit-like endonuclease domain-containing protein n=1 Tax=Corynebacterium diphtheriae bv. gravis TaxID=1720349 RepID=A0AAX0J2E0_CORDP|nr:terminase TerL endonuclease subunit [Corynebacterium diphtheriae]OFI55270.1 hypothetical protein BKD85_11560 [Corynebacterium diphtheriae]OFI63196.1 hypothetical protein BKD81_11545 [Corynebacterium diphtheriae]OIR64672.1 hypothetical protein BHF76_11405 [Corynebacterium diphtheriae]OIR64677.1 hypothetical protein BHF77_11430 [Corynebacterium diphtheriae]OIR66322.1 hypothetical protein BHF73_10035 [Corynebacterium diphtheriae]